MTATDVEIKYEITELYGDYIHSLILLITETYLGDDITPDNQRINHFKWCWDKNISNFKEEGINFKDTKESYYYFLSLMVNSFYSVDKNDYEELVVTLRIIWVTLFNFNSPRNINERTNFNKIYIILSKSLKNNNHTID